MTKKIHNQRIGRACVVGGLSLVMIATSAIAQDITEPNSDGVPLVSAGLLGVSQIEIDRSFGMTVFESVQWIVATGGDLQAEVITAGLSDSSLLPDLMAAVFEYAPEQAIEIMVAAASINETVAVAVVKALAEYDSLLLPDLMDGLAEVIGQEQYDDIVQVALSQLDASLQVWMEYAAFVGRHIPVAEEFERVGGNAEDGTGSRTEEEVIEPEQPPPTASRS